MPFPRLCLVCASVVFAFVTSPLLAEEPANFAGILRTESRATFKKVADYARANPTAADASRAWKWIFQTALEERLEDEAVGYAEQYLKDGKTDPQTRAMATQTLAFGLARSGKGEQAVDHFQNQLRFARLQNGGEFVDLGLRLATSLRVSRSFGASKKVLEETANKFFLDGEIRAMCENKIAKLELLDKDAPAIAAADSKGQVIELASLKGKVVLIDFWATNCGPCLEEFPNLKELLATHQSRGFEIIGISLDGDAQLVDAFAARFQIPWRMIVGADDVQKLRDQYFVRKIPSLYLVNREGKVVQFDVKGADLREAVEAELKK